ncbi:MAG: L-seryl-tRNA(Sec) selenium transferase [Firmicutes bacterium]|nr:L-seryl-tRNA(Sec) selenium transferase [Bacillota bacterium]
MTKDPNIFRSIPKIDEVLKEPEIIDAIEHFGKGAAIESTRVCVEEMRSEMTSGKRTEPINQDDLIKRISTRIKRENQRHLRPVINGTGIILHTNLGRAVLSEAAAQAAFDVARNYSNLEYNCDNRTRGSRYSHVDYLLEKLCNCESALVVNNNAAAVLLMLSTLTKDKEVIVSRGELVEIGGAFRVPEIMEQSGTKLIEVGTTNKTKKSDYEKAIVPEKTGAILKVHTSNFKIMGFTEEASLEELAEIGESHDLPVLYDLGSGGFFKAADYGLSEEPNVFESMKDGADVICFSGDKLLGGPQAGIIIGKKKHIDAMKKNPLTRALRVDKMTLAALEATLRLYLDWEKAVKEIPLLSQLSITTEELVKKAETFMQLLKKIPMITAEIIAAEGQVGGGSMPNQMIPSICVALEANGFSANALDLALNSAETPIIGRIHKDCYLLDMRTIETRNFDTIVRALEKMDK